MNETYGQRAASFCVNADGQTVDTRHGHTSFPSIASEPFAPKSDIAEAVALFCAAINCEPLVADRLSWFERGEGEVVASRQERDITASIWTGSAEEHVIESKRQRRTAPNSNQMHSVNACYDIDEQFRRVFQ